MTLPVWATDPSSLLITEEEYEALPEDVTQSIEVVDGRVIFCESPTPTHQMVLLNLAVALKAGRPDDPCVTVLPDTDMRYVQANSHARSKHGPFTVRRPDISVLWCLEPGARLTSADVFVAVEISSSNSITDFQDKKAEYASQGIAVYMIVVMDETSIHSVEEYRLDWSGRNYQLAGVHRNALNVKLPENVKLSVTFDELEQP